MLSVKARFSKVFILFSGLGFVHLCKYNSQLASASQVASKEKLPIG